MMAGRKDSYTLERRYHRKNGTRDLGPEHRGARAGRRRRALARALDDREHQRAQDGRGGAASGSRSCNQYQALHDAPHRPAQPHALPRPHRAGHPPGAAPRRAPRRGPDDGPRQLQGGQRLARPPRRRRAARRSSAAALRRRACAAPTRSPASAATSSASCCPRSAAREEIIPALERIRRALERPVIGPRAAARRSRPRSESRSSPTTAPTSRRSSSGPTWRCTRPRTSNAPYSFYDEALDNRDPSRLMLVGELRRAIEERELVLYYQPKAHAGAAARSSRSRRCCAGTTPSAA